MCVICISPEGAPQPDKEELRAMFLRNPHGAGYMVARKGKVEIHKGFMSLTDLLLQLRNENFSTADNVIYHFRISTQAGISPEMTQPFPLTKHLEMMEALDVVCPVGIAHNGIIALTSNGSKRYSDTALFAAGYLPDIVKRRRDLLDDKTLERIGSMIGSSKMAFLDGSGFISMVGEFTEQNGILYSNLAHKITMRDVKTLDLLDYAGL